MFRTRPRRTRRAACLAATAALVVLAVAPLHAQAAGKRGHSPLQVGSHSVAGWTITTVQASHPESNWWAWHDSRPQQRFFYRGSWQALGRTGGWYEKLTLTHGNAQASAVILVSYFPSPTDAQTAYEKLAPANTSVSWPSLLSHLPIGNAAVEWRTNAGIASGMGPLFPSAFGGFTTFLWSGTTVAEIRADEVAVAGKRLAAVIDPGPAIARQLAREF